MNQEKVLEYAKSEGYDGAEYIGQYQSFFCYTPFFDRPFDEGVPPIGLPRLILVDCTGNTRFSSPEEAVLYGDTIKDRLEKDFIGQFGGRMYYACPSGCTIYTHRGRDYHLDEDIADPEVIMKASLEQGKTF